MKPYIQRDVSADIPRPMVKFQSQATFSYTPTNKPTLSNETPMNLAQIACIRSAYRNALPFTDINDRYSMSKSSSANSAISGKAPMHFHQSTSVLRKNPPSFQILRTTT